MHQAHKTQRWDVSDLVGRQVAAGRGDVRAVVADDGTLTYDELRRRVNRAGHLLMDRENGARDAVESVRFCVSAAEPLPATTIEHWRAAFDLESVDGIESPPDAAHLLLQPARSDPAGHNGPAGPWL